ncbi:EmrB/QacA subfamily drug resistance transporter [Allocatelliglobosispora scoriae]|uniref:EmrB/QacA subfamily drug resistance transporter n=1 Tax=Allocatelliglobosispora scoriae TaxID=643052 RepID=A0A841BUR8_9ACTN|nr:MFS transporter [Allocatelliglobosispora scoriae]MBB5871196.1 EmrB/QacA subfamily drug resistance transporter [Allocatelliglobosispora scoriae]
MVTETAPGLRLGTARGRGTLVAAVLASGMAFLDSTVVNVALPKLGEDLHAEMSGLQWVVNGYTLTLAAFVLLGGALGDRFGRRRVFLIGVVWFALASVACGFAPSIELLVFARIVQGVGAALLVPGSLAMIQASFDPAERGRAIGAWSGLSGVSTAVGPFIGGWLIDSLSWRWIFFINIPLAVGVVLCAHWIPESRSLAARNTRFDIAGSMLGALGLAGITYALIAAPEHGLGSFTVLLPFLVGIACLISFVQVEKRRGEPGVGHADRDGRPRRPAMLPPSLFTSRVFTLLNIYTLFVYGAFGGIFFFLVIQLQSVSGYSALEAGIATLPITLLLLIGSAQSGALATRIGPRPQLVLGPLLCAAGALLLHLVGPEADYITRVLPGVLLFGLGLMALVAPLTSAVLAAVEDEHAGVASGVNNTAARAASLLAVAALPLLVGLSGAAYANPVAFDHGFNQALWWCAGLLVVGGVLALLVRVPGAGERPRRGQD